MCACACYSARLVVSSPQTPISAPHKAGRGVPAQSASRIPAGQHDEVPRQVQPLTLEAQPLAQEASPVAFQAPRSGLWGLCSGRLRVGVCCLARTLFCIRSANKKPSNRILKIALLRPPNIPKPRNPKEPGPVRPLTLVPLSLQPEVWPGLSLTFVFFNQCVLGFRV